MTNFEVANARISGFSTFLGGLSMIALMLSVNLMAAHPRPFSYGLFAAQFVTIASFLGALVILFSSTVSVVSAYTDAARPIEWTVRLARRLIGVGVVLTLVGIGTLLVIAFGFDWEAFVFGGTAYGASVVFWIVRWLIGTPPRP